MSKGSGHVPCCILLRCISLSTLCFAKWQQNSISLRGGHPNTAQKPAVQRLTTRWNARIPDALALAFAFSSSTATPTTNSNRELSSSPLFQLMDSNRVWPSISCSFLQAGTASFPRLAAQVRCLQFLSSKQKTKNQ